MDPRRKSPPSFKRKGTAIGFFVVALAILVVGVYLGIGMLTRYDYEDVLPEDAEGFAAASAIYMDKEKRLLAVSVRGIDGIRFFDWRKDGLLEKKHFLRLHGSFPRDIHLFPDGAVLAAYEKGGYAELFRVKDGNQMELLARVEVPCPTRILTVK